MATLSLQSITKQYGPTRVVDDVSLEVGEAEFIALLGPSGCGKTTLLRMIAGFIPQSSGQILINSHDVSSTPAHQRNAGMVFQNYALFPHMTVGQNVAFGLKMRGANKTEISQRTNEALALVKLDGLAGRYPRELSGGQQQRVAVARALVIRPDAFLLDEPLSNLDATLRQSVGLEIRNLQRELGLTTVFVTHDQNEALALADRLVLMNHGSIVQTGTAVDLYNNPANTFVAGFLGQANLIRGTVLQKGRFVSECGFEMACDTRNFDTSAPTVLCLRPENIVLGPDADKEDIAMDGKVILSTYLGSVTEAEVEITMMQQRLTVHIQNRNHQCLSALPEVGMECRIGWSSSSLIVLPGH